MPTKPTENDYLKFMANRGSFTLGCPLVRFPVVVGRRVSPYPA